MKKMPAVKQAQCEEVITYLYLAYQDKSADKDMCIMEASKAENLM